MRWKCDLFRRTQGTEPERDCLHRWILSLPWVEERPRILGALGVRTFAVSCEPLDVRQLWLVTGLRVGNGMAMIVPNTLAERWESHGLASTIAPMSARHTLLSVSEHASDLDVERVILEGYGTLLS